MNKEKLLKEYIKVEKSPIKQTKKLKFKLIKEVYNDIYKTTLIESTCVELFGDEVNSLYESAQEFLGKIIAQLQAGKDPNVQDERLISVLTGLVLLADPVNREAFNLTDNATVKLVDLVGKIPNATEKVARIGAYSKSTFNDIKNKLTNFPRMEDNQKREFLAKLNKLRLIFSQLKGKVEKAKKVVASTTTNAVPA